MNDLIDKFPKGQELYNTNSDFNRIVNYIYQGASLYEAISIFAEINKNQQEVIKDLIQKQAYPNYIVLKEQ